MTRHRHANYACKSSRYTLNKGEVIFEKTGDPEVDLQLSKWQNVIEDMIALGKKNDVVSLMLPQAYQYRWVVKFNARSLQNFFRLRLDKHAHYHIREVAEEMYKAIPECQKFIFEVPNEP
jgi:thymidylate synthase (FAD)